MRILTRYLLSEFFKPFLLATAAFSVLHLVFQIFNDIHMMMEFRPTLWVSLKYFLLQTPRFTVRVVPIAVLFGVLFSLSGLAKTSELIAMRAGGVGIFRVAVPLFFSGLFICFLTIFFNEAV